MHRLAATPGGWTPDTEGVIFVEQAPAPIVFLTAADTEIQTLSRVCGVLPENFPAVRAANLLQLQQQLTVDTYAEDVLSQAQVIIVRLLGGQSYWSYGLEVVQNLAADQGIQLLLLPGDDRPDPDLISRSTVPLAIANRFWRYCCEGGLANLHQGFLFLGQQFFNRLERPHPPTPVPAVGAYDWQGTGVSVSVSVSPASAASAAPTSAAPTAQTPATVGILFYRAHYLAGNTAPIDALCKAIAQQGLHPLPLYISSLREAAIQAEVLARLGKAGADIQVLINTTGFAIDSAQTFADSEHSFWRSLNVPVLQAICSGGTEERWRSGWQGLSPADMAMNVALPEVDGRIITRAISFKAVQARDERLETEVVSYEPVGDRIAFVAELAARWVQLRQTPIAQRRIALVLANYPTRDGRLANGVGLDTPESCVRILRAMQAAGYELTRIPPSGQALIEWLTAGITNDPEGQGIRPILQGLSLEDYKDYFLQLPAAVRQGIEQRWGVPQVESPSPTDLQFPVVGLDLGAVFVGIQPSRGYDQDPSLNYHAPDLEPTHTYLAFYRWLRSQFQAQAIVHVGKHGNLEWLPGKSIALSEACYPEVALGPLPHLYPFIVNDPGEGSQAKRRAQAVILDHLTPPLTRAELYGPLSQIESLVDEYYDAQRLDPKRVSVIRDRLLTALHDAHLQTDLGIELPANLLHAPLTNAFETTVLPPLDTYLCELKEAQIRDGLHIFGQCPEGPQLRDLAIAIARLPDPGRLGLTRAIALDWNLEFDPLTAEMGKPLSEGDRDQLHRQLHRQGIHGPLRTLGDGIEALEQQAIAWVNPFIPTPNSTPNTPPPDPIPPSLHHSPTPGPQTQRELTWIRHNLLPRLRQTDRELHNLLRGLDGQYIPSGPSGAPTRGRSDVLPTGRNFYSVDTRALPTESAWDVGRRAAEAVIERYTQDQGDYPRTLGLSLWGTATMRTGGDDLAEALALLGVRPVWEGPARRVVDFEILPLSILGRPRVDVTLRISGFFRDAFPNLIDLFDQAVIAVAQLDESPEQNPLAAHVRQETQDWQGQGLSPDQAQRRSQYRIFGSKPGAYGAGLQGLIEAQNWESDRDLAQAYINWSSYAYGSGSGSGASPGHAAPEAFQQRLKTLQIVLHNQDNREHDLLDSDDYYQFQGGLTAAVRTVQGQNPTVYFGDHARPENPKVRPLSEEIARVYRSRVVNPKWITGVMRHGYKGAFELAATVDYLFAYDATTHCVEDHMYAGVAQTYLLDPTVQAFVQQHNPWALRDMAERLLEAGQRGLWKNPDGELIEKLRAIALQAEEQIETRSLN